MLALAWINMIGLIIELLTISDDLIAQFLSIWIGYVDLSTISAILNYF
jgi:hypothetical protein